MSENKNWRDKLVNFGEYLQGGFHAMPSEKPETHWSKTLPSQHRLYNAVGMFSFFIVGGWLRDTLRGFDSKGKEIKREDVLLPFRFLHKALAHNPHSDAPRARWFKTVCQIVPAIFGATGAILGSVYFFRNNTSYDQRAADLQKFAKEGKDLGLMQANDAGTHYQSWPMRMMAGVFATFSAASGLTVLYGICLNSAFSFSNNRKMFTGLSKLTGIKAFDAPTGNTGDTYHGPAQALARNVVGASEAHYVRWAKAAEAAAAKGEKFVIPADERKQLEDSFVNEVIKPLFPEYVKDNEAVLRENIGKLLTDNFHNTLADKAQLFPNGATPEDLGSYLRNMLAWKFSEGFTKKNEFAYRGSAKFIKAMHDLGMQKEDFLAANTRPNGFLGKASTSLLKMFGQDKPLQDLDKSWVQTVENNSKIFQRSA